MNKEIYKQTSNSSLKNNRLGLPSHLQLNISNMFYQNKLILLIYEIYKFHEGGSEK